MNSDRLPGIVISGLVGVLVGMCYSTYESRAKMAKCFVSRVVEQAGDDTLIEGHTVKAPYTVVVYQPAFERFIVPGIFANEGDEVYLIPPSRR